MQQLSYLGTGPNDFLNEIDAFSVIIWQKNALIFFCYFLRYFLEIFHSRGVVCIRPPSPAFFASVSSKTVFFQVSTSIFREFAGLFTKFNFGAKTSCDRKKYLAYYFFKYLYFFGGDITVTKLKQMSSTGRYAMTPMS